MLNELFENKKTTPVQDSKSLKIANLKNLEKPFHTLKQSAVSCSGKHTIPSSRPLERIEQNNLFLLF